MATPAVQQRYRTCVVRLMEFIDGVVRDVYPYWSGIWRRKTVGNHTVWFGPAQLYACFYTSNGISNRSVSLYSNLCSVRSGKRRPSSRVQHNDKFRFTFSKSKTELKFKILWLLRHKGNWNQQGRPWWESTPTMTFNRSLCRCSSQYASTIRIQERSQCQFQPAMELCQCKIEPSGPEHHNICHGACSSIESPATVQNWARSTNATCIGNASADCSWSCVSKIWRALVEHKNLQANGGRSKKIKEGFYSRLHPTLRVVILAQKWSFFSLRHLKHHTDNFQRTSL
jgi:hypothetical protein